MHAGEPEQPVQQSVVIASMRGRFLRAAFPSPADIGQCLSTMSYIQLLLPLCSQLLLPIADCRFMSDTLQLVVTLVKFKTGCDESDDKLKRIGHESTIGNQQSSMR
jgi:hypothetical protein